jgi:geranylgeranyl diphosphate synthase, type II
MHSIENLQNKLLKAFANNLAYGKPAELYDPIKYTMELGGKRMRPLLVLLGCDMFDRDIEQAMDAAIGIELFHNFTLLHDDIMDQAPLRRGKETVYKRWNANRAILSGDTMFAIANRYLLRTPARCQAKVLDIFNQTAIEVCEGQQLDMNFEILETVPLSDYLEMIRLKTAVLLAVSLKIGAMIGGASDTAAQKLYDCGISLGIAFQLTDDLLDAYGDEATFGKMTGGDIVANKKTYLYIVALERAESNERLALLEFFASTNRNPEDKINEVKLIFNSLGVPEVTRQAIRSNYDQAMMLLKGIGLPDQETRVLHDYAITLMQRQV